MDVGVIATGVAAAVMLAHKRRDLLGHMLVLSWVATTTGAIASMSMATMVFTAAAIDISIAAVALIIATIDPKCYRARVVGGASMALMPLHWVMSATHGAANWTAYAIACNACFVFQCLVVGGWLDGLGSGVGSFVNRVRLVRGMRRHRG